jgi:hypothetical protein
LLQGVQKKVKKPKPRGRIVLGGVAILLFIAAGVWMRFPPGPRPLCHKAIDGAFQQWTAANDSKSAYYPNANGNGGASLAMIKPYFGDEILEYTYVPGLRYDDPNDLVLMYMKKKTRHTWHGDTQHTIFAPLRWMVLSPDILDGTCPEGGMLVDTPEFKRRLLLTVAFLKERQRPYWQAAADGQMEFLKSITE